MYVQSFHTRGNTILPRLLPLFILILMLASCRSSSEEEDLGEDAIEASVEASELSNQRVTAFVEDRNGCIWIGTFRGLNRYNSHQFRQFFCTDSEEDLPDNQITHLYKDSTGRLWVSTISGIAYHNDLEKFTHVPFGGTRPNVKWVFETTDNRLFAVSGPKVGLYNPSTESFDIVIDSGENSSTKSRNYIFGCLGPGGNIWIGAKDCIDIYDAMRFSLVESIPFEGMAESFFRCTGRNFLWVATRSGVHVLDMVSRKEQPLPEALAANEHILHGYCNNVYRYDDNSLLLHTDDGLYMYNMIADRLLRYDDVGFPFDVPDFINALYTDSHRNLWIGSYDKGFCVRAIGKKRFNANHHLASHTTGHSVNSVTSDSKDRLWMVLIPSTLYMYDPVSGSMSKGLDPEGRSTIVFADSRDNIWIGSLLSNKVRQCIYDGKQLHMIHSYNIERPMSFASDNKGNVWVSSGTGVVTRISSEDWSMQQVKLPVIAQQFVSTMAQVGNDMVVGALNSPLYKVNINDLSIQEGPLNMAHWQKALRRSFFIPTNIVCDSYNDLWIGTVGNGLLRYHSDTDSIERMRGLPCTDISSIIEDRQGNIWVSSMHGLSSYDRTTGSFSNYFTADGTGGDQYYDRSVCMLTDGTLVFGGTHGLTTFNSLDIVTRNEVPLIFDGLKIHNKLVDPSKDPDVISAAMYTKPQITLEHDQNGFGISFAALDYVNSEHSHYFYKLDGHDRYWVDAGNNNEAYYANLPTGNYTFRVKASFGSSDNAGEEIAVPVTIKPAPWFSWWAILLMLLVSAALICFIIQTRLRYLRERKSRYLAETERAQQERLNDMNMSFFANISHEFRTPLTMISGPVAQLEASSNLATDQRRMISVIKHNVSRMLRLINQLMDFNKLENDTLKLQVEHIDMMGYLRSIAENFAVNTSEKGIHFHTSGMEDEFVTWVDIDKIEKITSNLLSNSLKFTPTGGKIDFDFDVVDQEEAHRLASKAGVDFKPETSCIKITVKDSGPGIPEEMLHKVFDRYYQLENQLSHNRNWGSGIGLYYSRSLATLHHGVLFAGNRPEEDGSTGAVFTLLLPIGEDVYRSDDHITATAQAPLPANLQQLQTQSQSQKNMGAGEDEEFKGESHSSEVGGRITENIGTIGAEDNNSEEPASEKPKILVVDDDTEVVLYLRQLLSSQYTVLKAFDAESALKVIYDQHPDLIISDVVMPGIDGYDFCRRIKEDIQICHTPVILVTAKATIENQIQGLNTGADAYVPKPFDPIYILALIQSQLDNRRRARTIISNATETSEIAPDVLTGADKAFMNELYALMQSELSNSELDITRITEHLHISRTKLFYKIKALTGETPGAFFRTYKLNRAAEFIIEGKYTMAEIADITGFSTQAHFSTSFKKHFGVSPSAYASKETKETKDPKDSKDPKGS